MKTNRTLKADSPFDYSRPGKKTFLVHPELILFVLLFSLKTMAQNPVPAYPSLTFNSPVLISGIDREINATYRFPNVINGVDAHVTISGISGGARLIEIDNTSGAGYYDAFQPYVAAAPNDTSYIDWTIIFKKAGTSIDTTLAVLAITGVDVDGDGSMLKEFIQAATPGSFALAPDTYLSFGFDGVRSTATSTVDNVPLIDTAQKRSMFQMNFANINTILYRNGAISTYWAEEVRQTSIYFKSFFNTQTLLPVKLLSFDAKTVGTANKITWSATNEIDLKYYIVEKSVDGNTWEEFAKISTGSNADVNNYSVTDYDKNKSTVFYRLRQANINGLATYSKIVKIDGATIGQTEVIRSSVLNNKINLNIKTSANDNFIFDVYTLSGAKIAQAQNKIYTGNNQFVLDLPAGHSAAVYLLVIKNKSGRLIYNSKIVSI
ncbi:MAG: C-terminal target protein [Chitinophagaceae bacterium]|nr:C-terminal target protein [Chitinophagaceae bacterium]